MYISKVAHISGILAHLADFFCMCMHTNVLSRAKMAQLSGMFIYPVVHGVHCISKLQSSIPCLVAGFKDTELIFCQCKIITEK